MVTTKNNKKSFGFIIPIQVMSIKSYDCNFRKQINLHVWMSLIYLPEVNWEDTYLFKHYAMTQNLFLEPFAFGISQLSRRWYSPTSLIILRWLFLLLSPAAVLNCPFYSASLRHFTGSLSNDLASYFTKQNKTTKKTSRAISFTLSLLH